MYLFACWLLTSSISGVLRKSLVDEVIDLVKAELATSEFAELLVQLFLELGEEFSNGDGSIDLLVPFLEILPLLSVKGGGDELLEEALSTLHVVMLVDVLNGDVQS